MNILPKLEEVKKLAVEENYKVVPVSCELLSDFTTPIETMKILKNVSTHCYMLESAQANDKWGRYTFLGFEPKLSSSCVDGEFKAGNLKIKTDNPSEYLRQILADYKSPHFDYLPSFTGGLARYHSLAADKETIPEELLITAQTTDGEVMAVKHREYPVYGVQFHPESIMTPNGKRMMENFLGIPNYTNF